MEYKQQYKNALEKARELLSCCIDDRDRRTKIYRVEDIESIFPELKESEDERIRKELITHCRNTRCVTEEGAERIAKWVAWLEKQGEQNFADKIEPKFNFKVGQWIVATGKRVYLIAKIDGFNVTLVDTNGDEYVFHVSSLVDAYQWTIADAKDGDVLVCPSDLGDRLVVFIFKQLVNNASEIDCHCCIDANGIFDPCLNDCCYVGDAERADYSPATKKQRDLLFQKMKEAGYEWDAEKKELKRIGQKSVDKTESKFKVGDWIVNNVCLPMQIASIKDGMYIFTEGDAISVSFIDENYHLWTIQDAKDGDVLVDSYSKDSIIILYKGIYKERTILAHCGWNEYNLSVNTNGFGYGGLDNTNYLPATKEQCDLLFQKIKEAGYEWDTEKKELKRIESKELDADKVIACL